MKKIEVMNESEKEIFKCAGIKCIKLNKLNGLPIKNTVELGNEYVRMQSTLKRIADICKYEKDKGFVMSRYGCKEPVSQGYDLACRILKELEIYKQVWEVDKYRKALEDIKKIVDARCNECKYGKDEITCKFGDCGEAKLHLITQLITKAQIEECENE